MSTAKSTWRTGTSFTPNFQVDISKLLLIWKKMRLGEHFLKRDAGTSWFASMSLIYSKTTCVQSFGFMKQQIGYIILT